MAIETRPGPVPAGTATVTRRIAVRGTVQGVGFRPFVWRLATGLRLDGTVRNLGGRVEIVVCGPPETVAALADRIRTEAPPRARVESVAVTAAPDTAAGRRGFTVIDSASTHAGERLFPPDLATCDACLGELFDPANRRYRYPFINCTDCGPRASIIDALPYDRRRTTMRDFPLCPQCRAEYTDPADRRFHAEPVACPACGPRLTWRPDAAAAVTRTAEDALSAAVARLAGGGIIAVKGIGGYHLACLATDPAAVRRLRERKHRWAKPLAVMVPHLAAAGRLGEVDEVTAAALNGPARPIVLVPGRPDASPQLAPQVSAGTRKLGLFLPYTGLHHLLLAATAEPIVLTSGNRCDEPIAVDDDDALHRLAGIADGFLGHDRRIHSRYEDSVVTVIDGAPLLLRRGRGFAPEPLALPIAAPEPILATGAQLKHTFAIADAGRAHLGGHTGDLADLATLEAYQRDLAHLRQLLDVDPGWVAHDLHPGYLSTQQAVRDYPPGRRIAVQHHHAHIAACMAEHGVTGPVVGVALDGLGMGDDGTFWGGEVLIADLTGYRRVGRFGRAPLPGGEAAIRQPWRMALGYLFGAEDDSVAGGSGSAAGDSGGGSPPWADAAAFLARFDPATVGVVRRQIERGLNAPLASSAGRLFDAASSMLGLHDVIAYEGQAAIAVEQAADPAQPGRLPYRLTERGGLTVYDPRPTLAALLAGVAAGQPVPRLAAQLQRAVAAAVAALATRAARAADLRVVCLSGGVFANEWLASAVPRRLTAAGYTVLRHRRVPPGDGGISYGQAAIAAARLAAGPANRPAAGPHAGGGTPCV